MTAIEAINKLTGSQVADLYHLYQLNWWTKGRALADVKNMLRHSNVVIGYAEVETGKLIAFARVLTDYVYKALIFDVIVDVNYQKQGLGRALMDAILNHPDLESVNHFELYCLPEMMPFYHKWGFTDVLGELRFMRRG
jgi:GNAT superfamily N-acetyltransferase